MRRKFEKHVYLSINYRRLVVINQIKLGLENNYISCRKSEKYRLQLDTRKNRTYQGKHEPEGTHISLITGQLAGSYEIRRWICPSSAAPAPAPGPSWRANGMMAAVFRAPNACRVRNAGARFGPECPVAGGCVRGCRACAVRMGHMWSLMGRHQDRRQKRIAAFAPMAGLRRTPSGTELHCNASPSASRSACVSA